MKGRKDILQKVFAGCLAVMLGGGGMNVSTLAMEKKETVLQEKTDQTSLETREMEESTETEKHLQTYEPKYVTVGDTSTYTLEDGSVKMTYVSMNDITLAEDISLTGDCGEVKETEVNGVSEDFFNDCSTNYGFEQLNSRENADDLKKLYVNILAVLQETYYSTNDIEKSNFGGQEYYCAGKVDYSTLGVTNEELFQVYNTVLYDHPLLYFTKNTIVYDGRELYMIMDEKFASGAVRADYSEKISTLMEEFETLTAEAGSNYEIVKLVHDKIIQLADYAFEADGVTPKNNGLVHSIAGYVSEEKEVVCDGYAKTFGAVLNYLDIENIFVTGWSVLQGAETSDETAHAWNMVQLGNGDYYYVDVTYDDGGDLGIFDTYLCVGQEIFADHSIMENGTGSNSYFMYELPACAAEKFTGEDTLVKVEDPEFKVNGAEEDYMKDAKGEPCGETLYWELSEDGVMTISGMGKMWDFRNDDSAGMWGFDYHQCPWEKEKDKIKSVVFKPGISYIGADAFTFCENLTRVTFCDTLKSIAPFAFWKCKNLGNFELPEGLTVIGQQAFGGSEKLTSIVIPDSVTFLDAGICENDINLTYAYIGGNKNVGSFTYSNCPFRNCTALEAIEVSEDNYALQAIDGVLYSKTDSNVVPEGAVQLVQYPPGKKDTTYKLVEKTYKIEQFAMEHVQCLEEIIIPDTVLVIGNGAIRNCPRLKFLVIPSRVQSIGLGIGENCNQLEYIENKSEKIIYLTSEYCYQGDESKYYVCWKNRETKELVSKISTGVAERTYVGRIADYLECFEVCGITYQMLSKDTGMAGMMGIDLEEMIKKKFVGKVKIINVESTDDFIVPVEVEHYGWKYEVEPYVIPTSISTKEPTATGEPSDESTVTNNPTTHKITYNLKGGTNHKNNPATYKTKDVVLKAPQKKGYTFEGWYLDQNYKKKITKITAKEQKDITVYAKWKKVSKPSKPVIKSLENIKGSKLKLVLKKKTTDVRGFEVLYSTDKAMKKSVKKASFTSTSKTISKLKKGKTYYVKVCAYKLDSAGKKVYGSYSNVKKVQIKK